MNQDADRFASMPTPVLRITGRSFAPDLIRAGLHLASARLRDALSPGQDVVEFREVDTSGCAAAARAADHRVFRAVHQADPEAGSRIVARHPNRKRRSWHLDEACFRLVPDIRGTGMKLAGR